MVNNKPSYNNRKKVKLIKNIDLRISKIPVSVKSKSKNIVRRNFKTPIKKKVFTPVYTINKTKEMNWKQLKKKYPNMNPTSDADFDGLVNARDCKPLDPSKDGMFSRFIGKVTGDKYGQSAEDYKEEKVEAKRYKIEKKEGKALKKAERQSIIERKVEMKAARQIAEKGYAPSEVELKRDISREKLAEFKKRMKVKAKEMEKQFEPEKSLAARLVKKAGGLTSKRDIEAKRISGYRKIAKSVKKFSGVTGATSKTGKTAKGQKLAGAGRPKGSYKYRDPRTGEPVTAIQYHKLRKQLKTQAKTVETQAEVRQRFALAKRGLSPEEVAQTQEKMNLRMARLRAIKAARQEGIAEDVIVAEDAPMEPQEAIEIQEQQVIQQQVQQIPTQVVQQQIRPQPRRVGHPGVPPGYRLQEDLMTGRKTLVPLPTPEAWTR